MCSPWHIQGHTVAVYADHDLDNEFIADLPISRVDHEAFSSSCHTIAIQIS